MAEITASLVKELRERTGAGMMECKNTLFPYTTLFRSNRKSVV